MSRKFKVQKAILSGHSSDSRNMSLRDSGKPNKLIIARVARRKRKTGT